MDVRDGALGLPGHGHSRSPLHIGPSVWCHTGTRRDKTQQPDETKRLCKLNDCWAEAFIVIVDVDGGVFIQGIDEYHACRVPWIHSVVHPNVKGAHTMADKYVWRRYMW